MTKPRIQQLPTKRPDLVTTIEEEARTERTNFPDTVKAEVFARDCAICAFTGMNLWLLDEGAGGFYNDCWIDHIVPATRGGKSIAENGVATLAEYNYNRGNSIGGSIYLFMCGMPTYRFWEYNRILPVEMAQMIMDNYQMEPSDYYFNQAIRNLVAGVEWLNAEGALKYKRDADYFAEATNRRLEKWKKTVDVEGSSGMEERNLVPELLTTDQELMLSLREAKNTKTIKALMKEILPHHKANLSLRLEFEVASERWAQGEKFEGSFAKVEEMLQLPDVSIIVVSQISHNLNMMIDPFAPWNDQEALDQYFKEKESGEVN